MDPVKTRYAEKVELKIENSEDQSEKLNKISRSGTYAFIHPEINVIFICLFACTFRKVVGKTIGGFHGCTIIYCADAEV